MSALLDALFAQHKRSLLWVLRRIVQDQQAAEDLAQETYLKTHQAFTNRRIDHLEQYIFKRLAIWCWIIIGVTAFAGSFTMLM